MGVSQIRVSVGVGGNETGRYHELMQTAGLDPESFNRAFARKAKQLAENIKESGGTDIAVRFVEVPECTGRPHGRNGSLLTSYLFWLFWKLCE